MFGGARGGLLILLFFFFLLLLVVLGEMALRSLSPAVAVSADIPFLLLASSPATAGRILLRGLFFRTGGGRGTAGGGSRAEHIV